jgi:hypothetical protein
LTALAAVAAVFVALAAGYFINKANSSSESVQNPIVQPIQEPNVNIDQPETITNSPVPEVSNPLLSENIEQAEVKPASIKLTTIEKRAAIEKRKTIDEPPVQMEVAENLKPAPPAKAEISPPAVRRQAPRPGKSQPGGESRSRVVESQSAPDIESIFTGRPADTGSDGGMRGRQEELRRQREQMSDEELREMRRQRRQDRKRRPNSQPFPF